MPEHLLYDGKLLHWKEPGDKKPETSYKATSGMNHPLEADKKHPDGNFQNVAEICTPDKGPVPPGTYILKLWIDPGLAKIDPNTCGLEPSWKIQTIPRGADAKFPKVDCEPYVANWGHHRIRFEPYDGPTKAVCAPVRRGGFHLHDSAKGFSHGCIEVETRFFARLKRYAVKKVGSKSLLLKVKYAHTSTYGGTRAAP